MKQAKPLLGAVFAIAVLAVLSFSGILRGEEAVITIAGTPYTMQSLSVRDFTKTGYSLATMTVSNGNVYFTNYSAVTLEAKTSYSGGISLRPKDGSGTPISAWVYNPTIKPVELGEGKIYALSCDVLALKEKGIPVSIAGLELGTQSREEIISWLEQELKGYQFSENEDSDAFSFKKGRVSYTFSFHDDGSLKVVFVRDSV